MNTPVPRRIVCPATYTSRHCRECSNEDRRETCGLRFGIDQARGLSKITIHMDCPNQKEDVNAASKGH